MTPQVYRTITSLREAVQNAKDKGHKIGVVPTMGALHKGHLSLVKKAQEDCKFVIVTIFVNPTQFNSQNDLSSYPRCESNDLAQLSILGVDAVFVPDVDEIYPEGHSTKITVGGISNRLEGEMRPGHFDGVATVVAKLFGITRADRGYFGEKDWQQLQVVCNLVQDLNIPIEITGCPTHREDNGLALSSRNRLLTPEGHKTAASLVGAMREAARNINSGAAIAPTLQEAGTKILKAGFETVEYLELRDGLTLEPLSQPLPSARLLAAAWLEGVRLIDNIALTEVYQ